MDWQSRRFLGTWALSWMILLAVAIVFNIAVDPYGQFDTPRIVRFNANKPVAPAQLHLMKAYEVLRENPNTIILGSSRAAVGLNALSTALPANYRPAYNLAIPGGSPFVGYRYLQHVMAHRHVSLVILGLEFEYFLQIPRDMPPNLETRLAVIAGSSVNSDENRQRIRDHFQAALSLDALSDSVNALTENLAGTQADFVSGNVDTPPSRIGSLSVFALWDLERIRIYRGRQRNLAMGDVQAIIDLCESRGTRVILFVSPSHADELEMLELTKQWQAFENWKRELLGVTAKYPDTDGHPHIPLWDFSTYTPYTTESLPNDQYISRWFDDPMHYTRALGEVLMRRIFGGGDRNFGVLLRADNLEQHLANIRTQQHIYREHHEADVQRVQNLYNAMKKSRE